MNKKISNKKYVCELCKDTKRVIYIKMIKGRRYEFAAACVCDLEHKYIYEGRDCEHKTENYMPSITEIFPGKIPFRERIIYVEDEEVEKTKSKQAKYYNGEKQNFEKGEMGR